VSRPAGNELSIPSPAPLASESSLRSVSVAGEGTAGPTLTLGLVRPVTATQHPSENVHGNPPRTVRITANHYSRALGIGHSRGAFEA
jgi:hypothetical protein